jgi:anti-sigma factor RsiW
MTSLTELTCAVYVDGELSLAETRATARHLAECAPCRRLVAALRDENRVIGAALGELAARAPAPATAVRPTSMPGGRWAGRRGLARGAAAAVAGFAGLTG